MSSVCPRNIITNEWLDPEHVVIEDQIRPNSFDPIWRLLPTGRIITRRASADEGQQKSSVSHCLLHNVRQHCENASETSTWPCLTASNHENHNFSS